MYVSRVPWSHRVPLDNSEGSVKDIVILGAAYRSRHEMPVVNPHDQKSQST